MATSFQTSNPIYYSLSESAYSGSSTRTVELRKRPNQQSFGFYIGEDFPSGLYVVTVERGSPAAEARIQPGDRVLAVNGQLVSTVPVNPKQMVIRAASHAQSLTLTIQPTDLFQDLDLTKPTTYSDTNHYHLPKSQPATKVKNLNNDLEGYIKSLFANEDIQILPSASETNNSHNFTLTANPYAASRHRSKESPRRHTSSRSQDRQQNSPRRTRPKRIRMVTKETQTTARDENTPEQPQPSSPTKYQPLSHPSMGKSQLILRSHQSNPHDGESSEPTKPKLPTTANLVPAVSVTQPSSAILNKAERPSVKDQPKPSVAPAMPTAPILARSNSTETNQAPPQHMVDIVKEAMKAANTRNQGPAAVQAKPTPVSPKAEPQPPPRAPPNPEPQPPPRAPPKVEPQPPPPYRTSTDRPTTPVPSATTISALTSISLDNRPSANEGSYNVPSAENKRVVAQPPSNTNTSIVPMPPSGRHVHLVRQANFQGYGFHLQYNKAYYLVHRVEPNSPAVNGGLQANDVVLSINNQSTDKMLHANFVQIVNSSSQIDFVVQGVDEYLRANPQATRTLPPAAAAAPAATPTTKREADKPKSGLSRALEKISGTR